jgi:signal recognition particle receptor subunit beta
MMINWQERELIIKIVYYGPAMSGKTTNLEQIHSKVSPEHRSNLLSLKNGEDRTLFFDFVQIDLCKINGFLPRINLYTVPGQSYYKFSRNIVLAGADGVVFVADSAPDRSDANVASWQDMGENMGSHNLPFDDRHVVIQCNKQDLIDAMSPEDIRQLLGSNGIPLLSAAAIKGEGVYDTLKKITAKVFFNIEQELIPA